MDINEYLEVCREEYDGYSGMPKLRPSVVCGDGLTMSIQASSGHYCRPRTDYGPYSSVEIGFPNREVPEFFTYAENTNRINLFQKLVFWFLANILKEFPKTYYPTNTIYSWVPVELVDEVLVRHGGISNISDVVLESE